MYIGYNSEQIWERGLKLWSFSSKTTDKKTESKRDDRHRIYTVY